MSRTEPRAAGIPFLIAGALLGLAMTSSSAIVYQLEGSVSEIAALLPLGYAFAAGMVATVNPCGVLLLPSLVAYAVASLACTLPIFLVVVGSALATNGALTALLQFISYSLGMGVVLTAVILGAAFFQELVSRWIRRVVPYVHRVSASFLIGAGIFLVNYWLVTGHALG